jgi:putative ABC transport system ATP-binding protein
VADVAISLRSVTRRYGSGAAEVTALRGVSLDVPAGEFLSVMGPSGSGKSTLLNIIAGLDQPDSGQVEVAGHELSRLSRNQRSDLRLRSIGIVFQAFNLFPGLTVEENVVWPVEFLGVRRREAEHRANVALDLAMVPTGARQRWPAELSGGEQQRVAIARAIVTEPTLLLADEPTGHLDSRTGQAILDLLAGLNSSRSVTVVMVTHNIFAATYGHRTVEIRDGELVRDFRAPPQIKPQLSAVPE